ncbi:spore cortex biosynthesis protein YabQ [Bacillus sp. Y1]|jgi:spore cortex biosynthesis protein YabQ|uniref:spore cortex biosynthesis protein YabQ n=1 Tax=Robertmurraya sp. TaxID=2837525 RepID=UPI00092B5B57|nr:spore cortex biosynthesis protein YabQ [Bacillus sp. Y1]AYA74054.1 spore cortex biosynthesis protein YabQ [Bacillus sp. Y1]SHT11174.1 spore cortex biosynthesis protein YabQ [Mycobacteroides abscessus subsp. abscessus]
MTLTTQFLTMISMAAMGSYLGAAIDTYNRFLFRSKRKSWLVFLNDIFFWILQGLIFFYVLFVINQGELRFYIFLAILCGFAAYQSLLKRGYARVLEIIITMIISIYRYAVKIFLMLIYRPIVSLLLGCVSLVTIIGKGLFVLVKWTIQVIWTIIKLVFTPVKWLLILFWNLLPKHIKKTVEKLYNKLAGYYQGIKNTINNVLSRWRKDKE